MIILKVTPVFSHMHLDEADVQLSRRSTHSSIPLNTYQPPLHISTHFNMIQQVDVETTSKLRDIAFATTDQNAQRQKLLIEDEIEYKKIKTDTLIEQTQCKLDHENELLEIENARMKAENGAALLKECTENEAALLKARTDKDNEAMLIKAQHDAK